VSEWQHRQPAEQMQQQKPQTGRKFKEIRKKNKSISKDSTCINMSLWISYKTIGNYIKYKRTRKIEHVCIDLVHEQDNVSFGKDSAWPGFNSLQNGRDYLSHLMCLQIPKVYNLFMVCPWVHRKSDKRQLVIAATKRQKQLKVCLDMKKICPHWE